MGVGEFRARKHSHWNFVVHMPPRFLASDTKRICKSDRIAAGSLPSRPARMGGNPTTIARMFAPANVLGVPRTHTVSAAKMSLGVKITGSPRKQISTPFAGLCDLPRRLNRRAPNVSGITARIVAIYACSVPNRELLAAMLTRAVNARTVAVCDIAIVIAKFGAFANAIGGKAATTGGAFHSGYYAKAFPAGQVEKDPKHFQTAKERIERELQQLTFL